MPTLQFVVGASFGQLSCLIDFRDLVAQAFAFRLAWQR